MRGRPRTSEIAEITETLRSGKGPSSTASAGGHSPSGGFGVDKKEVAVWKLLEDVTKVQFRQWGNAMDIQLEAIHGWKCADYVLNRIKRSDDEIDAKVLEK